MNWTRQQQQAIRQRGSNVLVSAAAGSGKTAVLTERIRHLTEDQHVPLERMLVVTFTNAAASEMRDKILRSLRSAADRASGEERRYLRYQISCGESADICTFHRFSMKLIRRYFYLTDSSPDFSICDEGMQTILQDRCLDRLMEDWFESRDPRFTAFLTAYTDIKSDQNLRNMIRQTYRFIMSMPEPLEWLHEQVKAVGEEASEFREGPVYGAYREHYGRLIRKALRLAERVCEETAGIPSIEEKAAIDLEELQKIYQAYRDDDTEELSPQLGYKWQTFRASREGKEAYAEVKDLVSAQRKRAKEYLNSVREAVGSVSFHEAAQRIRDTAAHMAFLEELILDFHERFRKAKKERNLLDFNDVEQYALQILKDDDAAAEIRNSYDEIFIDEYQDSSLIQEAIIQRISRGDNVYMVGDVKQSIYRFRLADPDVFVDKYHRYAGSDRDNPVNRSDGGASEDIGAPANSGEDAEISGVRIDLNRNFRSSRGVIEAVNGVFSRVMTREQGGIEYDESAMLIQGKEESPVPAPPASFYLIDTSRAEELPEEDAVAELKADELEARTIADLIEQRLQEEMYDAGIGRMRSVRCGDIVILMRSTRTHAGVIMEELRQRGIPSCTEDSDGYFETGEIEVFMNLLRVIDNRRNDVPLISVLHSSIFGFSTEELAEIRIRHMTESYSDAFLACAESAGGGEDQTAGDFAGAGDLSAGEIAGTWNSSAGGFAAVEDQQTGYFTGVDEVGMTGNDFAEEPDELALKCADACRRLDDWRVDARYLPLPSFLWKLMLETGYFHYVAALPGGEQRVANLRTLIDRAVDFTETQMQGLFGFVRYAEQLSKSGVRTSGAGTPGDISEMVRIMTIHKSKGLEFPIVIAAGLQRRFRGGKGDGSGLVLHKKYGMALRYSVPEKHIYSRTITQQVIESRHREEDLEEEMRVLYVAMTRARDELILTASVRNSEKLLDDIQQGLRGDADEAASFIDWILPNCEAAGIQLHVINRQEIADREIVSERASENLKKELREGFPSFVDEQGYLRLIQDRFDYRYPYMRYVESRSKFAVTALSRAMRMGYDPENQKKQRPAAGDLVPDFLREEHGITPARAGTLTHRVLELIPFEAGLSEEKIRLFAATLVEKGLMTEVEAAAVNYGELAGFFASPLGHRAASADELRREWAFTLRKKTDELIAAASADAAEQLRDALPPVILVQGIIDCCFMDEQGIVIVDFKTDHVRSSDHKNDFKRFREQYSEQLHFYREAVEREYGVPVEKTVLYLLDASVEVEIV